MTFALFILYCMGQNTTNYKGYIIHIEDEKVYIDLHTPQVKIGDKINIVTEEEYIIHPVTKVKIKKTSPPLGMLIVEETEAEYAVTRAATAELLEKLKIGMEVVLVSSKSEVSTEYDMIQSAQQENVNDGKFNVVIEQAAVNDILRERQGYFGGYVADMLAAQLLMCEKVRLLDRSIIEKQLTELELSGYLLDRNTTIKAGKAIGADYIIKTTIQKPDVVNVRTKVPLQAFAQGVEGLTGRNLGSQYWGGNTSVGTLEAKVNLTVQVINMQTGEVEYLSYGNGKARGKAQISVEQSMLSGLEVNGGVDGFRQTITGQALAKAFNEVGCNLNGFFNGEKEGVKVDGMVMTTSDKQLEPRGYKLYMGTERLSNSDLRSLLYDDSELYFKYRKAKRMKAWSWAISCGVPALTLGIVALGIEDDGMSNESALETLGSMTAVSVISGILINVAGKKKIKEVANTYNARHDEGWAHPIYLGPAKSGIGLCLTF